MEIPKSWQRSILAAALGLGVAQAAPASPPESQRSFASADEAVKAFVAALRDHKEADLRAILGAEADRVVNSGEPNADRELHQRFVALYDERHAIEPKGPGQAELEVGSNHWSLPIPLIKSNGRWSFDTKAGAQAVIDRRIGRNELSAIRALRACVDAQRDYFNRAKRATGSGAYATRLVSTPGSHDGLYWPVAADGADSPLEPLIDAAQDEDYPSQLAGGEPVLYGEYHFRVLKAQGQNGAGGAKSYIQDGRMTGGFALIAWPAGFESTGIMTFIVGPSGDVYQKDLGPDTARIAAEMAAFDPDPTWSRVEVTND